MADSASAASDPHAVTVEAWVKAAKEYIVPPLDFARHKGQNGRVCVVGGALEFTGAPYFSAMAALQLGMDLAYVITTPEAATPIKTYSPELIVYPIMPGEPRPGVSLEEVLSRLEAKASAILKKCDVVVMGPGMGAPTPAAPRGDVGKTPGAADASRGDPEGAASGCPILRAALTILNLAMKENKFLVIDADMIRVLCAPSHAPSLQRLKTYRQCLLTPNKREFDLLQAAFEALPEARDAPPCPTSLLAALAEAVQREQTSPGRSASASGDAAAPWRPPEVMPSRLFPAALLPFARGLARIPVALQGPSLLVKAPADVLVAYADSAAVAAVAACGISGALRGSPKRSGGQGDILSGVLAAFVAWWLSSRASRVKARASCDAPGGGARQGDAEASAESVFGPVVGVEDETAAGMLCAAFNASLVVRRAAARAFNAHGRSMLAQHLLADLGAVVRQTYDQSVFSACLEHLSSDPILGDAAAKRGERSARLRLFKSLGGAEAPLKDTEPGLQSPSRLYPPACSDFCARKH
ncbi:carbohydrate kinase [Besnoitia besnoiti]|uniref:ATP-dependent (S)-NAD(P)H-hydrate dehydratase n=1 Tax=Besnoitia besnoiti TaxID=94643 RepID=A0A2A9M5J5_BESBE|nr:carbohydrate kinase [Besnoitia besnoiti]PFH33219.1 carbohydrate kinase [Besnoitia besnoiti]